MIVLVALVAGLLAATAPVAGGQTDGGGAHGAGYLIVELTGSSLAHDDSTKTQGRFDPGSAGYARALERLQRQHARFIDRLAKDAPEAAVINQMFITANAVVVELNGTDRDVVTRIPGVARSHDSQLFTFDMDQSVDLINAPAFWANNAGRENAGAGVRIAIIDTGIVDSLIPGFHSFFGCKTVEFGGIYFSGATGAPSGQGFPAPGVAFVFDHGQHVGGIAGGCVTTISDGGIWDGVTLSGVAPGATLVDYNVFPGIGAGFVAFGGSAFSHDIAAAIEDAVANGDHIINMSLGGTVQGPRDFLAGVSNAAVAAGVTVVTSAGNEGPGSFTVGSPGSAAEAITVGATTNTRGLGLLVIEDPGGADNTYDAVPGDFANFDGTTFDLANWSGSDVEACTTTGAGDHGGEVVLISRGSCTFTTKIRNAENTGAAGVIVYNNAAGAPIGMAHDGTEPFPTIPAVMVSQDDGAALVAAAPSTVLVTPPTIVAETPNELAGFSSRGPAPFTYAVKPDVVAPGVNILSSVFVGFDLKNGTSMASPHVAGAAAALLAEHPNWTTLEVKSALVTTAVRLPDLSVWEQGGGLIDLDAADGADTFFYPSNASFGVWIGNKPANGSIDIAISGTGSCSIAGVTGDFVSASVNASTLTVAFEGGRTAATAFYDGYVDLECSGTDYHIPWGAVVRRTGGR